MRRVGIDGVDGAGKTTYADDLARQLRDEGEVVVRASVDDFHQPRARRWARGRDSPEGFFLDSYDYDALHRLLLDPLAPGGDRVVRRAWHDLATDARVDAPPLLVADGSVLVVDGIFLHRPELAGVWDLSVWLEVSTEESVRRCAQRDGTPSDPADPANRRYVEGQRRYRAQCRPEQLASYVIPND